MSVGWNFRMILTKCLVKNYYDFISPRNKKMIEICIVCCTIVVIVRHKRRTTLDFVASSVLLLLCCRVSCVCVCVLLLLLFSRRVVC